MDIFFFPFSEIGSSTWTSLLIIQTKQKLVLRTPIMEITDHNTGHCDLFLFNSEKKIKWWKALDHYWQLPTITTTTTTLNIILKDS